jgi:hypothetical protein
MQNGIRFYHFDKENPLMPIEFSVAAYRFGHSQIRPSYRLNFGRPEPPYLHAPFFAFIFDDTEDPTKPDPNDLRGRKRAPRRFVDWQTFFKFDAVGSGDQRNTIWGMVELEGDRDGTHGTSRLVCGPESRPVASVETWAVVERDRPGTRQARWIDSWRGVIEWGIHSSRSEAVALGADAGGARRDFAWHGDGSLYPADRRHARSSAVDRQPGNHPPWWSPHVSRR